MDFISNSPAETEKLAKKFIKNFPDTVLVGLSGDLGSGKTAFVKGLSKALGIKKNVTSPTFVIEKIYQGKSRQLIHIDAYRLSTESDLQTIGFYEFIHNPKNIIVIEWPEKVFSKIPERMRIIKFSYVDENKRKINW